MNPDTVARYVIDGQAVFWPLFIAYMLIRKWRVSTPPPSRPPSPPEPEPATRRAAIAIDAGPPEEPGLAAFPPASRPVLRPREAGQP